MVTIPDRRRFSFTVVAIVALAVLAGFGVVWWAASEPGGIGPLLGTTRCEDDTNDVQAVPPGNVLPREPAADLSTAELTLDGQNMVVAISLVHPFSRFNDPTYEMGDLGSHLSVGLQLRFGSAPRDFYSLSLDWGGRTARFDASAAVPGAPSVAIPSEFSASRATATLSLSSVDRLADGFRWYALATVVDVNEGGMVLQAQDGCPGQGHIEFVPGSNASGLVGVSTSTSPPPADDDRADSDSLGLCLDEVTRASGGPPIGPERAATCLYESWQSDDRTLAELVAERDAVERLFERAWTPPEAAFQGCSSSGKSEICWFDYHGVLLKMTMDGTPSLGATVEAVAFIND